MLMSLNNSLGAIPEILTHRESTAIYSFHMTWKFSYSDDFGMKKKIDQKVSSSNLTKNNFYMAYCNGFSTHVA